LPNFDFPPFELPPEAQALRGEVRAFLSETLAHKPSVERARSWSGGSKEFSQKLGAQGWIGMTWPKQ
jgi:alkylation response protein AidB-like acyl-CoA dehydrogenase